MDQKLVAFIDGPLSDKQMGSASAIAAARDSAGRDKNLSESTTSARKTTREFELPTQAPLFDYQQEIVSSLGTNLPQSQTALVSLPTGAGKTRTAIWFIRELIISSKSARVLWIAPSTELVDQAVDCATDLWNRFPVAVKTNICVNKIPKDFTRQRPRSVISFVTAQLAARQLDSISTYEPDIVIFDEAHQAAARTFSKIVRTAAKLKGCTIIGLSATPGRTIEHEAESLSSLFGGLLVTSGVLGDNPIETLTERGVLSRLDFRLMPLPSHWDSIRVSSLKSRTLSLDKLAVHNDRFWSTVNTIGELPAGARTLVFGASLAHCHALAGALRSLKISAEVVSYETPPSLRKCILNRFRDGEVSVLLNKAILATGYDCPGITDVVLATPIRSPILWEQIIGRVSRGPAVGGTKVGVVWEIDDHRKMHKKVLSYARYMESLWVE